MQPSQMRDSVKACLTRRDLPRLEVQLLLAFVLQRPREWLIAHDDHVLTTVQRHQFDHLCQQRLAGHPMAYLVGQREFMGLSFTVSPDVLIPRPETELLVEVVLGRVAAIAKPHILDLGTGSGAIALALARARPDACVYATDVCDQAITVAQRNAKSHGLRIEFGVGDWFDALPDHPPLFDLIVSNPPYIRPDDIHLSQGDLRFEPRHALTEGVDGLSAYRTLASACGAFLVPGGWLCVEHGFDQAEAVTDIFLEAGLRNVETKMDLAGHPRVTTGSYNR